MSKEQHFLTHEEMSNKLAKPDINGENGMLRAQPSENLIDANNDWAAIQFWITNKFDKKVNSKQQYLLQAERLLLWAIIEKEKPISSLTIDEFKEYFRFLDNPQPHDKWCMSKGRGGVKRWDKNWRPFTGPLSASSKSTAINCINTMLNYWTSFGYIKTNVLKMVDLSEFQQHKNVKQLTVAERALSKEEWQAIQQAINNLPQKTELERQVKMRLRFLLTTFLVTALRRDEVTKMKWNDFGKLRGVWRLQVTGKGNKPALLVLPDGYITLANEYRALFKYAPLHEQVERNDDEPVFMGLRAYKAMTGNYINRMIKDICEQATCFIDDKHAKMRLKQASAHWIRHTAATVLDDSGVDKDIIKTHLRHESSATTELYIHKNVEDIKIALDDLVNACV